MWTILIFSGDGKKIKDFWGDISKELKSILGYGIPLEVSFSFFSQLQTHDAVSFSVNLLEIDNQLQSIG